MIADPSSQELLETRREILAMVRDFVDERIIPAAPEYDRADEFPDAIVEEMKELGLFGITVPEEHGGLGLDLITYAMVCEELARGWMSITGVVNTHFLGVWMLMHHGTDEQRQKWLPKMATGEWRAAYSMTEPHAGSDVQAIKATAVRDGDELVLNGQKMWVTNGLRSGLAFVLFKTDPDAQPPYRGMTCVVIEKEPGADRVGGLTVPPKIRKLGYKGVETTELILEDHRVPAGNVLGGEAGLGQGFKQMMAAIEVGRINVAARGLGVARRALEISLRYAQERESMGKPIAQHQLVQAKLANMATKIEAARALTYTAAEKRERGERADVETGMAKLFSTEMCDEVVNDAFVIHGGYGYSDEYPIERLIRDTKGMLVTEGTSDILRLVIAKGLLRQHKI